MAVVAHLVDGETLIGAWETGDPPFLSAGTIGESWDERDC